MSAPGRTPPRAPRPFYALPGRRDERPRHRHARQPSTVRASNAHALGHVRPRAISAADERPAAFNPWPSSGLWPHCGCSPAPAAPRDSRAVCERLATPCAVCLVLMVFPFMVKLIHAAILTPRQGRQPSTVRASNAHEIGHVRPRAISAADEGPAAVHHAHPRPMPSTRPASRRRPRPRPCPPQGERFRARASSPARSPQPSTRPAAVHRARAPSPHNLPPLNLLKLIISPQKRKRKRILIPI